jgi:mannosyltransferase OCH1-like enzyme
MNPPLFFLSLFFSFWIIDATSQDDFHEYNLDVFPVSLPPPAQANYTKNIPRNIWIAVRDKNDELPSHLKAFFANNPGWNVNICDNQCKDQFMNENFRQTSLLWAYNIINPLIGAARADVWRYAVLYLNGGYYMDEDSDMKTPLDEVCAFLISTTVFSFYK